MIIIQEILDETAARHPEEACGIVLRNGTVICLTNIATDPTRNFEVDPLEVYMKVLAPYGADNVAVIWHSHPGGRSVPSQCDWDSHPPMCDMWIVAGGEIYDYGSQQETIDGLLEGSGTY